MLDGNMICMTMVNGILSHSNGGFVFTQNWSSFFLLASHQHLLKLSLATLLVKLPMSWNILSLGGRLIYHLLLLWCPWKCTRAKRKCISGSFSRIINTHLANRYHKIQAILSQILFSYKFQNQEYFEHISTLSWLP